VGQRRIVLKFQYYNLKKKKRKKGKKKTEKEKPLLNIALSLPVASPQMSTSCTSSSRMQLHVPVLQTEPVLLPWHATTPPSTYPSSKLCTRLTLVVGSNSALQDKSVASRL